MPLIGGLLTTLFSGLVAWLTVYVTRKVAFGLAAVAAMSALTLALYVVMRAVMTGLNSHVVNLPEFWAVILSCGVPPAAPFCLASYVTIWTACTVYTWQRDLLHVLLKV
jgi:hypothetical protein